MSTRPLVTTGEQEVWRFAVGLRIRPEVRFEIQDSLLVLAFLKDILPIDKDSSPKQMKIISKQLDASRAIGQRHGAVEATALKVHAVEEDIAARGRLQHKVRGASEDAPCPSYIRKRREHHRNGGGRAAAYGSIVECDKPVWG